MSQFTGPLPNAWELNSAKTRCIWGHPFTKANTYVNPAGWRECRACHRLRQKAYLARRAGSPVVTSSSPVLSLSDAQKGPQIGADTLAYDAARSSSLGAALEAVSDAEALASPAEDA